MRDFDPATAAELPADLVMPAHLVMLTFRTETKYAWSGPGTLVWNGNSFLGVGSLGKIGDVNEGVGVTADGTTVTLSGIDPALLGESMTDIKSGAPAKIWFALLRSDLSIIGTPYLRFAGTIDTPELGVGGETVSITLNLENRMVDMGRATQTRYTAADQRLLHPDDTGFNSVEALENISLRWGM